MWLSIKVRTNASIKKTLKVFSIRSIAAHLQYQNDLLTTLKDKTFRVWAYIWI